MKVETHSQNWSSKLWPQPEGECVISAAARSFGAMFSCMCFFCSGDLPVPLSPSLKRNTFKITARPPRDQSKKGRGRVIFGPLGAAGGTHQYVLEGPTVPSIGSSPGWMPFHLPAFSGLGSRAPQGCFLHRREGWESSPYSRSPHFCPAPGHSSCTGREPGQGFTFSRVLLEFLGH